MNATWHHPTLGQLVRDDCTWSAEVIAPAFDQFSYANPRIKLGPPRGRYGLLILDGKIADAPPGPGLAVAARVLARQQHLVGTIANALWDEFHGRGPNSGLWWYGSLTRPDAARAFDGHPLTVPDDVTAMMQLTGICVSDDVPGCDGYVAHLSFKARFEQEHDVGVLTDGERVLGTGYVGEVTAYGFL